MAQEQNYQVNYSINVDASQGTKQGKYPLNCIYDEFD